MPDQIFKNLRALLDKAGITVSEASEIFKVSRPTIYFWCDGHPPTQGLLLSNALRMIKVIERACDAGSFKGFSDLPKEERMAELVKILRGHLNGG